MTDDVVNLLSRCLPAKEQEKERNATGDYHLCGRTKGVKAKARPFNWPISRGIFFIRHQVNAVPRTTKSKQAHGGLRFEARKRLVTGHQKKRVTSRRLLVASLILQKECFLAFGVQRQRKDMLKLAGNCSRDGAGWSSWTSKVTWRSAFFCLPAESPR